MSRQTAMCRVPHVLRRFPRRGHPSKFATATARWWLEGDLAGSQWRWTLFVAAAILSLSESLGAQSDRSPLQRVRVLDSKLQRAFEAGRLRSDTFRNLVDAVERSRAILYIATEPNLPCQMEGAVALEIGGAGPDRYLRMMIKPGLRLERLIVVIGHELQHVAEILEAAGRGDLQNLLTAAGTARVSPHQHETRAALDAGAQIAAELRQEPDRSRRR